LLLKVGCILGSFGENQSFNLSIQTAFVTGSFILVNNAFISDTVDDRYGCLESFSGDRSITSGDSFDHFLDIGTHHGAQAGIMLAALFVLAGTLFGGFDISQGITPALNLLLGLRLQI